MYVHEGKRKYYVTVREIEKDNTLGESESFSVYESQTVMDRSDFAKYLIKKVNETHKEMDK